MFRNRNNLLACTAPANWMFFDIDCIYAQPV